MQREPRPLPSITHEQRERQKARLRRNSAVDPTTGCWLWLKGQSKGGYGQTSMLNQGWPSHRLAYFLFVGDFDPALDIDHLCRVRACCNPEHLEPVPTKVNLLRSTNHIVSQVQATHCSNGHPYGGDNLIIRPSGRRGCRACIRQWKKESDARRAQEGRLSVPKVTHCKRGHAYDEVNTYWSPAGARMCRACARVRSTQRKKAA